MPDIPTQSISSTNTHCSYGFRMNESIAAESPSMAFLSLYVAGCKCINVHVVQPARSIKTSPENKMTSWATEMHPKWRLGTRPHTPIGDKSSLFAETLASAETWFEKNTAVLTFDDDSKDASLFPPSTELREVDSWRQVHRFVSIPNFHKSFDRACPSYPPNKNMDLLASSAITTPLFLWHPGFPSKRTWTISQVLLLLLLLMLQNPKIVEIIPCRRWWVLLCRRSTAVCLERSDAQVPVIRSLPGFPYCCHKWKGLQQIRTFCQIATEFYNQRNVETSLSKWRKVEGVAEKSELLVS